MKKSLRDVLTEIKNTQKKIESLNSDIVKYQKVLLDLFEQYYSLDNNYLKVVCFHCRGDGFIKDKESKITKRCSVCNGSGYLWMQKFKDKDDTNVKREEKEDK